MKERRRRELPNDEIVLTTLKPGGVQELRGCSWRGFWPGLWPRVGPPWGFRPPRGRHRTRLPPSSGPPPGAPLRLLRACAGMCRKLGQTEGSYMRISGTVLSGPGALGCWAGSL